MAFLDYAGLSRFKSNFDTLFTKGPSSSTSNGIAIFDGTGGKTLKDSGFTIGKSVPSDAKFTDTTYSAATTSANGLMSSGDKTKLNGIATGAEVNQNAFSNVIVGSTTVAADSKTDTLTLVAGSNVTLTPDATNDKITIAATDTNTWRPMTDILAAVYPIGSIYMSVVDTSPATLFGGTWEQLKDRFLLGAGDTYTAGDTGGNASQNYTPAGTNSGGSVSDHTLTVAEIPSHNHSFTGSAVTSGGISANHTHTGTSGNPSANHTHTGPSHKHSGKIYYSDVCVNDGSNNWIRKTEASSDTGAAGTGATGNVSAWHTHTTTTGNQSAGHTHSVTASGSIGNKGDGGAHNHGFTNPTFTGTAATINTMPPYLSVYMWERTA